MRLKPVILAGIVGAMVVLIAGADRLSAHEEFHFTGSIVKVEPAEGALCMLTVRFKWESGDSEELQTHVFVLNGTEVTRDDKPVPVSELKAGQHVIIDALGDDYAFTDAYAVRIVSPDPPASQ